MASITALVNIIDGHGLQLLVLLVIWATLVLGLAWLLTSLLRRASAAIRYCVWQFALMGLLVLPSLFVLLPGIPLGISLGTVADARPIVSSASPVTGPIAADYRLV